MDDLIISSINVVSRLLVFTKKISNDKEVNKLMEPMGKYGSTRYLRAWFDTFYDINNIFKVARRLKHHGSTLKAINFRTYPNLGTGEERNKLPYIYSRISREILDKI
jgi:hypothetical protein